MGTLNLGAIMSQDLCDDLVIAASKLLSVGSILSSPVVVKDVVDVGSTDGNLYVSIRLHHSLRGADGNFRVSAWPPPAPS